ncbi:MAG: hypothetical protein HOC79_09810 [Euryarchaeota archaeon]|nr:hypothetical protein [Euryarchaeota archaeon]
MISASTLHVITTELTIGMFSLAGFCFLMMFIEKGPVVKDSVAHWALAGGLLFTPLAIITGLNSIQGDEISSPLLANKMLTSMSAIGLSIGVLWKRIKMGRQEGYLHPSLGMVATGMILLTAGMGGEYARGETLIFFLPKTMVFLFPMWASIIIMILGIALIAKAIMTAKSESPALV